MPVEPRPRVLLVDDDEALTDRLGRMLEEAGYDVRAARPGALDERWLASWPADVAVVEVSPASTVGLDLVRKFRQVWPGHDSVVLTAPGSASRAVEALRAGAGYFLEKPVEAEAVLALVEKAVARTALETENARLKRKLESREGLGAIIGRSRKMTELFDLVRAVASSDASVLIEGENGTGKELVANAIHHLSKRSRGPFIKINCAALPKDLIESELFGYRRGAFTGAMTDRDGLLAASDGGSLLLDEIGEMPAYLQTKLLRVLQEREYRPVGSDRAIEVDFRLISATNVNVETALCEGRIREDLYFRINTVMMRVPPLRERSEDIPLLAEHFLEKYAVRHERPVRTVSAAAFERMMRARWPGNVRELENAIERAVLVARGPEIEVTDLPDTLDEIPSSPGEFQVPPGWTLADVERMAILRTLERTRWNKQEAAAVLGLYRPTLYSKMKKHGIVDPRRRARAGGRSDER